MSHGAGGIARPPGVKSSLSRLPCSAQPGNYDKMYQVFANSCEVDRALVEPCGDPSVLNWFVITIP